MVKAYNRQWQLPLSKWIIVNTFTEGNKTQFGGSLTIHDIMKSPRFEEYCKLLKRPATKLQAIKALHSREAWANHGHGFRLCREIMMDKNTCLN